MALLESVTGVLLIGLVIVLGLKLMRRLIGVAAIAILMAAVLWMAGWLRF